MQSLVRAHQALINRVRALAESGEERGDVPGWVLITLMTAALVAAIWAVAQGQILDLFERAMNKVSGI
ncbi:MAG: hypothetical protein LWW86_05585 [Micrococcales bacterium]|nr:hypothetical protein [Micrococcales bacterium]